MKTDSLFYRLFKNTPELVLELADLHYPEAQRYQFCSEEIKQTSFRLDGILAPPKGSIDLPLIFVEVQFQPDPYFYSRFFCEIFFYLHQNHPIQSWQAVVIYPTRQTETDGHLHYADLLDNKRIKRVYLEDLTTLPSDNNTGLQLVKLIITEADHAIIAAQSLLKRIKIQTDPQATAHWLEWIETILVYKLPNLSRKEIQYMLGYNDIELKQTRFYQDIFSEGKDEGKIVGKIEGEVIILVRLLVRRLGQLPDKTQKQIQSLNNTQLERLADAIFELNTLDDLQNWLNNLK